MRDTQEERAAHRPVGCSLFSDRDEEKDNGSLKTDTGVHRPVEAEKGSPQILFLSQCLPYPPHSGVTNRGFHILKQLGKEYRVRLLAFSRRNHQRNAQTRRLAVEALSAFLERVYEPSPIPGERSHLRRVMDHLRSLTSGRPYTYYAYASERFAAGLREALGDWQPDLIHLDSIDLYGWLPKLPNVPMTCTHHSIESELLRLRAERVKNPLLGRYLRHQANLVERVEREYSRKFHLNLMMSELDSQRLNRLVPGCKTAVVPNGVDTQFFRPDHPVDRVPGRVVFLGPTYMFPNQDAVECLLESIWHRVQRQIPNASLRVIGKCSEEDRVRFDAFPGVKCLGYIEDIRPEFARAECCVVPLRVGGGTRLKILDAWALGTAVVSTSVGCEGLAIRDGENILVRDDPESFAEAIVQVVADEELRSRLERNGRAIVERTYDWNVIGARLRSLYAELLM